MKRKYLAVCDDGHDYFDFEYYSESRKGSKQNELDAKEFYKRHHGKRNFSIIKIERVKED